MSEHRREPREFIAVLVSYQGPRVKTIDVTDNLSTHGMFVLTQCHFSVGTHLRFTLSFPGLLERLPLCGVVRWTRDDTDEGGVGLEFDDMDERTRQRLEAFLDEVRRIPD